MLECALIPAAIALFWAVLFGKKSEEQNTIAQECAARKDAIGCAEHFLSFLLYGLLALLIFWAVLGGISGLLWTHLNH